MRFLKFLLGLALIPVCAGATLTLFRMLRGPVVAEAAGNLALIGFSVGFGLWLVLYLVAPRPLRAYVLAHEFTHALWGVAMGARVRRLRVTANGGEVLLSKSNVWITLAPYFFPFYTAVVLLVYGILSYFWPMRACGPLWMGLIGLTWCFHLTFTVSSLLVHQTDLEEHGYIFSLGLIGLINVLALAAGLVAVTSFGWRDWMTQAWADQRSTAALLVALVRRGIAVFR